MDEVHLVDYDPAWPLMYAAEAERVLGALALGLVLAIEHFGSTAIPNMVAKPVIDLLVAVRSIQEAVRLLSDQWKPLVMPFGRTIHVETVYSSSKVFRLRQPRERITFT